MRVKRGGSRRIQWRTMFGMGVLLACLVPMLVVYRSFNVCASASSAALREFPAYGGARLRTIPNPAGYPEDCGARPTSLTNDTDTFLAYYREQLAAHGWSLQPDYTEKNESMTYRAVTGLRGNLCYVAGVEHYQNSEPPGAKQFSISVRNPAICHLMQQQKSLAP